MAIVEVISRWLVQKNNAAIIWNFAKKVLPLRRQDYILIVRA